MNEKVVAGKYDEAYGGEAYRFGEEPDSIAVRLAELLPPGATIVDYGCGEGRNAVYWAENGFAVTGFDISEEGLEKARRLARKKGVPEHLLSVHKASVFEPELPDGIMYDAIACLYVLDCVFPQRTDPIKADVIEPVIKGMKERTKAGGYVAIAFAPRYEAGKERKLVDRGYHENRLRGNFEKGGWSIVCFEKDWNEVEFGNPGEEHYWNNRNFDVRLIARKQ